MHNKSSDEENILSSNAHRLPDSPPNAQLTALLDAATALQQRWQCTGSTGSIPSQDHDKEALTQLFQRTGLETIRNEAEAVAQLASTIDDNFSKACRLLLQCQGHIIVTAIGKSGNIAAKIAATLASTGTPAFFLHPSDAAHGDLGVITSNDVVLSLSNSGETAELLALLPFLKHHEIPLIAISGNGNSTLACAASVTLTFSAKETCHLGLAPTSTTTAMLVLGDALAMALSQARGFTSDHFALRHPAGTLGRRLLLRVRDLMHRGNALPNVQESDALTDVLMEISHKRLGIATIVNEQNQLLGVFTDGDLRRTLAQEIDIKNTSIAEVMTTRFKSIKPDIMAIDALALMEKYKITCLPVIDNNEQLIGILHIHDLFNAKIL